ncbi:spaetzle-processing enzyme [Drosophila busckii]|uniref:spaetzle-processing enzyme n=1 Tax=Drosophila busckii TaxID=30019 RepID=UPI00143343DF|nr:spaetzle-processing enzyme [Drosophila busckii]
MKLIHSLLGFVIGIAVAAAAATTAQFSYGSCEAKPSKESGLCIHIRDCPYLYDILNASQATPEQNKLLADSQCGLDNTRQGVLVHRILVCCPESKRISQGTGAQGAGGAVATRAANAPEAANVLPSIGTCGVLFADRIIGGVETKLYEFPWMALLKYKKPNDEYGFHCGGTLINSRYVLTAGHCLASSKLDKYGWQLHSVRLGEWDTTTAPDCVTELGSGKRTCAPLHLDIEVEKRTIHELYVPNSIDQMHDIALLRLKTAVSYTDYVRPICLPVGNSLRKNDFEDYAMDVAGWGVTEDGKPSAVKLKITVDVWNLERCQQKYRAYQMHLNSSQMCAGGKANVDTCQGDSGGPLMVPTHEGNQEIFFVVGVTSYGPEPCGLLGWPGVYTRVTHFVDWIQQKLEP